jgi:voltage-gated potassium channel
VKALGLVFSLLSAPWRARNGRVVLALVGIFLLLLTVYGVLFHVLMDAEGQDHSWVTGFYWTLTTMSTLGFGDITFESDAGRVFSMVVLVSGALFILVLLPFAFIQFVFLPWMARRESMRAPRQLPEGTRGHIVLTGHSPIEEALIRRANDSNVAYVIIVPVLEDALQLHDLGYRVMVGALDDPATYRAARVGQAVLLATTQPDTTNTNIAFTVREISPDVPVVATASSAASVDILTLAGCDVVLQLGEMLGREIAERVLGGDSRSHVVGEFGDLRIAEAAVGGTALEGLTLREADLRRRCNVNVIGLWQRGHFQLAGPESRLTATTTLILAGSADQVAAYNAAFALQQRLDAPVVIIGGGRVGRAVGRTLDADGIDHRIIERLPDRVPDPDRYVLGDAAELEVLEAAGIHRAAAVVITTHDDDVNVYLALYCRKLRPEVQIIARANLDRNVTTLHRAGADAVLSYASTGATAIWNRLGLNPTLVLAEGLDVFQVDVPHGLAHRSLAEAGIRRRTGCNVVAIVEDGRVESNPDPTRPLPADAELIVIGDSEAERRFLHEHPSAARPTTPGPTVAERV